MVLYEYSNSRKTKRKLKVIKKLIAFDLANTWVEIMLINTYSFSYFAFKLSLKPSFDREKARIIFDQQSEIQGKLVLFLVENLVYSVDHVHGFLFYWFYAHNS